MNSESYLRMNARKLLEEGLELILVLMIRHDLEALRPRVHLIVYYEYDFSLHCFLINFLNFAENGCQYLNFTFSNILNSTRLCSVLGKK